MKIETTTRVRYRDKDGKRYVLGAGTHEVPAHVGEHLVKKGHAVAVDIEAPVAEPVVAKEEPKAVAAKAGGAPKGGDAPKGDAGGGAKA